MEPGSKRMKRGLANLFFAEGGDWTSMFSFIDSLSQQVNTPSASQKLAILIVQQQTESFCDKRIAHHMCQRFRKEDKFSGQHWENISERLGNYDEAWDDYGLNGVHKMKFVHSLFDGEAKQFIQLCITVFDATPGCGPENDW